jgi:hypothetical protein
LAPTLALGAVAVDSPHNQVKRRMTSRTKVLKQLVRDAQYVVDPHAVAEAIVVRSVANRVLPEVTFRSTPAGLSVRSFRPHRGARSFRLTRSDRRPTHRPADESDPSSVR